MDSKLTGLWVNFFTAAGIPSDVSATYALTFTENRIQNDMLLDLNKEYLRDMGITRMGDVIAILRHAKQVHESAARDKVLSTAVPAPAPKVPVAAITGRSTTTQPSSPASRILEHYTRNPRPESPTAPAQTLKRKSVEMSVNSDEVKKARSIRFSAPVELPKEGPPKTVFARLGGSEQTRTITNAPIKPIYSRLGSKSEDQVPIDKDALKYEGILKAAPQKNALQKNAPQKNAPQKKIVTVTTTKNSRKISCTMRADESPISVKDKLNLPKQKSVKFSNHIQYKEIETVKSVNKTVKPITKKVTTVFNKPERRLSMPETRLSMPENGVKSRLGAKNVNNLTITRNVFNRLGV